MRALGGALLAGLVLGCGGAGGGGAATFRVTGVVEVISNFAPPSPAATVQAGSGTALTQTDGSFTINVAPGTADLLVTYTPSGGSAITFTFTIGPVTSDQDVGTLVIGPSKVNASGRMVSSVDASPIAGGEVVLGGRGATSAVNGTFTITDVAFDPAVPGSFLSLSGRAGRAAFFPILFSPPDVPIGGLASLGDLTLQPDSGELPPGTPFTIEGFVNPAATGAGATVELRASGTLVRSMTVGPSRRYSFWVPPGAYTVRATKGSSVSPDVSFTLTSPVQTLRRDVTLP